jgi:hypothetical protein
VQLPDIGVEHQQPNGTVGFGVPLVALGQREHVVGQFCAAVVIVIAPNRVPRNGAEKVSGRPVQLLAPFVVVPAVLDQIAGGDE